MYTATKRNTTTEEELYGYNSREFSRRQFADNENTAAEVYADSSRNASRVNTMPVNGGGYGTRAQDIHMTRPAAQQRIQTERTYNMFGGTVVEDDSPVGSQGALRTPADRYYAPFNIDESTTYESRTARKNQTRNSVYVPPYEAKRAKNEFKFFTGDTIIEREPEKKPKQPSGTKKDSSIKPSEETFVIYRERKEEDQKKSLFTSRGKIMVAIYVAVVVFLIAMIITSGVTAGKLKQDVSALEGDIKLSQSTNQKLSGELILLSNESVLKDKAGDIDMVDGSGATVEEVTLVPVVQPVEYKVKRNWFDKMCDWLSGIFGG